MHFVLPLDSFPALLHTICCWHTAGNHVIYANCESIEFHALGSGKLDSSVNVHIPWPLLHHNPHHCSFNQTKLFFHIKPTIKHIAKIHP